jgi:hypothetical protein
MWVRTREQLAWRANGIDGVIFIPFLLVGDTNIGSWRCSGKIVAFASDC